MSQSATLYRITQDKFKEVEMANGKKINPMRLSEEHSTYQSSFMALEFILSKEKDESTAKLISEIFDPVGCIGCEDMRNVNFENISEEQLWRMLDHVSFLLPEQVCQINNVLNTITDEQVDRSYNSQELNENGIYPSCWHDDNSENMGLNKRQVLEDFRELRTFFQRATESKNYILTYVG